MVGVLPSLPNALLKEQYTTVFVLIDPTAKEIKKKYQVCFRHYHIHLVCQGQSLRTEDIQVSIDITKNKLDILYLCYRIF